MRIVESDAAATRALRRAVLRPSWPPDAVMHGDDASDAIHLAAYTDTGELVGACLLLPRPYRARPALTDTWQLRGMVTAEGFRSRGIGAAVLAAAVDAASGRGGRLVWCEARTSAMNFYRQHGFTVDGPEYLHSETAIPHHLMSRPLGTGLAGAGT